MRGNLGLVVLLFGAILALDARSARAQTTDAFSQPPPRDASLAQDASDVSGHVINSGCNCATSGGPTTTVASVASLLLCLGCVRRRRP